MKKRLIALGIIGILVVVSLVIAQQGGNYTRNWSITPNVPNQYLWNCPLKGNITFEFDFTDFQRPTTNVNGFANVTFRMRTNNGRCEQSRPYNITIIPRRGNLENHVVQSYMRSVVLEELSNNRTKTVINRRNGGGRVS